MSVRDADVSLATSRRHPSEDNLGSGQVCPVFQGCPHCCRAGDGTGTGFGGKVTAHVLFIGHATHVKMREVQVCHVYALIKHIAHVRHFFGVEIGEIQARQAPTCMEHLAHICHIQFSILPNPLSITHIPKISKKIFISTVTFSYFCV